jgi:hypothetical protein
MPFDIMTVARSNVSQVQIYFAFVSVTSHLGFITSAIMLYVE